MERLEGGSCKRILPSRRRTRCVGMEWYGSIRAVKEMCGILEYGQGKLERLLEHSVLE